MSALVLLAAPVVTAVPSGLLAFGVVFGRARRGGAAIRRHLEHIEEQLAFAHDTAGIASWYIDAAGRESWSRSFHTLLGVPAHLQPSTELFRAVVHPDDRATVAAADTVMLNRPGDHEFEYRVVAGDGSVRWLLARGRCVVDERGRRIAVHGVTLDITDRKREEEARRELTLQLVQAQKLETVGRLVSGVAHDFNNMLTGITGYAHIARSRVEAGEAPVHELDEVIVAAESAGSLTRQLLAFTRKGVLGDPSVDLVEGLLAVEGLLQRVIGEHIVLDHVTPAHELVVPIGRTQLEQIILNLVVNARDAMPGGGRVTVAAHEADVAAENSLELEPGPYAVLSVTDDGRGIEPADLPQIFEAFYTTKSDGTGLGLATVYGIVAPIGGTIRVQSKPGQGTMFEIYLPLAQLGKSRASERIAHRMGAAAVTA